MARTTNQTGHRLHVRVSGWVADDFSDRFPGITRRQTEDGSTVYCGELKDQSALFGILRLFENRGLRIIAFFAYPGGVA